MANSAYSGESYQKKMSEHLTLLSRLSRRFSESTGGLISEDYIRIALFELLAEKEDMVAAFELINVDLTFAEGERLLYDFDFSQFDIELELQEVDIPLGIFPDTYASIKSGGKKWRIHLNDRDPWPSQPHAHLIGSNIKLDLGNGDTYSGPKLKTRMPKKELLDIRNKFEQLPAFRGRMPPFLI